MVFCKENYSISKKLLNKKRNRFFGRVMCQVALVVGGHKKCIFLMPGDGFHPGCDILKFGNQNCRKSEALGFTVVTYSGDLLPYTM